MSEQDIQYTILQYLQYQKIFCWKQNNTGIYKQKTRQYIPTGMKGLPDIIAVIDGKFVGIEVKMKGNKQSPSQKIFQTRLEVAGGKYILAKSLEDVIKNI